MVGEDFAQTAPGYFEDASRGRVGRAYIWNCEDVCRDENSVEEGRDHDRCGKRETEPIDHCAGEKGTQREAHWRGGAEEGN